MIDDSSLEILLVTGNAGRGKTPELADCGAFVAGFAVDYGVSADQRKTILVILDVFD